MADNPFYFGYKQDPKFEEPSKMYPGYFPGRPQPRPPIKRDFLQPVPEFGNIAAELKFMEYQIDEVTVGFPSWVKERLADDLKQSFSVSLRGNDVEPEHLDDFDSDSLPGAFGVGLGNPIDWVTDPGKTLYKTVNKIVTTPFQPADLEARARTHLWNQILSDNPNYSFGGEETAAAVLVSRTTVGSGIGGGPNPLSLKGSKVMGVKTELGELSKKSKNTRYEMITHAPSGTVFGVIEKEVASSVDVYEEVAANIITFQRKGPAAATRDKAYDDMAESALFAIETELSQGTHLTVIGADTEMNSAYMMFKMRRELASDMGVIGGAYGAPTKFSDTMQKFILENGTADNVKKAAEAYAETIEKGLDRLENFAGHAAGRGLMDTYDAEEAQIFRKFSTGYKKHLEELKAHAEEIKNAATSHALDGVAGKAKAIQLLNKLDATAKGGLSGRGVSGGDLVVSGYQRMLVRDLFDNEFLAPRLKGSKVMIGDVVDRTSPAYAKRLKPLGTRLLNERSQFALEEVADNIEGGRLKEVYIWKRMKNLLTGLTPDYYVKHWMKVTLHKAGIAIDKYNEASFENSFVYKLSTGFGFRGGGPQPGKIFGNWFGVDHTGDSDPTKSLVSGVRVTGRALWGGKHFEGVEALHAMRDSVLKGELTPGALMYLIQYTGTHDATHGTMDFTNPVFLARLIAANGGRPVNLPAGAEGYKLATQVAAFRDWVTTNKNLFTVNGAAANVNDQTFWFGLIEGLTKRERTGEVIGMARRFGGVLDKLWAKLNLIQTKFLNRFGKYIAPLTYLKVTISEALAAAIPHILAVLGGAISGGALTPLIEAAGRFLKPILAWSIRKVMDFGQNFIGGILHGDFFKAYNELEKMVLKFLKFTASATMFPVFGAVFLSTTFFGNTLTTISPVDVSRAEPFIPEGTFNCTPPGSSCSISGGLDYCCPGTECKGSVCTFCKPDGAPSMNDCSDCCSNQCIGANGSKVCSGDANRPPPPGGGPPPPPAGYFGDGENCDGTFIVKCPGQDPGFDHPCFHSGPWETGAVDLQVAPNGVGNVLAPFDGESHAHWDNIGGHSTVFYPTDPSGDIQDDITSECPSFYMTHFDAPALDGVVTEGTVIGKVGMSGNAAGTVPHIHAAADTDGVFPSGVGDVNIIELFDRWGYPCTSPWNNGEVDTNCP